MSKKKFGHSWALLVLISSTCSMITMADWRRNELKVKSAVLKNRKRTCTRQVPFACSPRILRNWHQRNRNAGLKEVTIFLLFPPPPPAFLFHLYWVLWSFSSLLAVNFSSEIRQVQCRTRYDPSHTAPFDRVYTLLPQKRKIGCNGLFFNYLLKQATSNISRHHVHVCQGWQLTCGLLSIAS